MRGAWASHQQELPLNAPQIMSAPHAAQLEFDVDVESLILIAV
jgi:hypothetical protein